MQANKIEAPCYAVVSALGCEDDASVARRIVAMCAALAAILGNEAAA